MNYVLYIEREKRLVKFSLNSKLCITKDKFLLNKENKQTFLECLTSYMNANNIKEKQSYGDADVLVATTAIAMSRFDNVAVIGEDTDILILLLHHYDVQNVNNIDFTTEKSWDIKHLKNTLSEKIVNCILPIHAFLGCDTVSRVHSIGMGEKSLKKVVSNEEIQRCFLNLNEGSADTKTIASSGEKLLCFFYGGSGDDT